MDKTICSNHLTVPSDDDVPFADERHRYLRHCEEVGMTARSLKGKRNELLWIATRLSPDAPKGRRYRGTPSDNDRASATKWGAHRDATGNRHRTTLASFSRLVANQTSFGTRALSTTP